MPELSVTINGRNYAIACEAGQEEHTSRLAEYIKVRVEELVESNGQIGDARVLLMASLLVSDELSDAYLEAAADVVGGVNVSDDRPPVTGSEDFADMLRVVPGAYCIVGHAGTVAVHNPGYVLDPGILPVGASIMARIAERRLPFG